MKNAIFLLCLAVATTSCSDRPSSGSTASKTILEYFQKIPAADTLLFEVVNDEAVPPADTIPNSLFFSQLETKLMNDISYFDAADEMKVIGKGRFPLTENEEACVVDLRQHWYRHLSLFIFDTKKMTFTRRETVAEFYGGDGGQILTGSWLFDYDGDGDKDLVRREIEHWIILDDDNTRDTTTESAALLLWKDGQFKGTLADTAALVKRFPIGSLW